MKLFTQVATTLGVAAATLGAGAIIANADSVTVNPGDTLSTIASQHNTTVDQLATINHIANKNLIFAGEVLQLDANTTVAMPTMQVTTPVVKPAAAAPVVQPAATVTPAQPTTTNSGSVHDRFIAAGGSQAMWDNIVMPESGGNPNAISPNGYRGLGQTKNAWGQGSVEDQTKGMIQYAIDRYGSQDAAVNARIAQNWW